MPILLAFLTSSLGRWVVLSGIMLATWGGCVSHYKRVGAERVTAQIERKVEANAQKADDVRQSVQTVPVGKLLDKWTRD